MYDFHGITEGDSKSTVKGSVQVTTRGDDLLLCPFPSESIPKHARKETTLVKDINQSYDFGSWVSEQESSYIFYDQSEGVFEPSKYQKISEIPQESFRSIDSVLSYTSSCVSDSFSDKFIPDKLYCPACKVYTKPKVRFKSESIWKQVLCFTSNSEDNILYCCPLCEFTMTKIKFNHMPVCC